jgi:hypothetical protein
MSAGVLLASRAETRTAADAWTVLQAVEATERGVMLAAAGWNPESSLTMMLGSRVGPLRTSYPDSTASTAWITRLTPGSFWISATGRTPATGAPIPISRHIGVLHVLQLPQPDLRATVSVRDSLTVTGVATVDGNDFTPAWGALCRPPGTAMPGAAAPDTTRITGGGITGTPPIVTDSLAGHPATLAQLGAVTWTALAAHASQRFTGPATVTPGPRLTSGVCDTAATGNWGDPTRTTPCANRFVIVHAAAPLVMDGGAGQGIILAESSLELRNGARFYGLVLARGHIVAATGTNVVHGALISGASAHMGGASRVAWSSCALEAALMATAPLTRAVSRSWAGLTPNH